jgi:hypothetical protein
MSLTVRSTSRAAASLIRSSGNVAVTVVKFGSSTAQYAVQGAASLAVSATTVAPVETHYTVSMPARMGVTSLRMATGAARVSARAVGTVATGAIGLTGRALAATVPSAVSTTPIVAGAVEVAAAAFDTAVVILECVGDECSILSKTTAGAVGGVVTHNCGPQAGSLVQEVLFVAVDVTEIGREMAKLKLTAVGGRVARSTLDEQIRRYHDEADAQAASGTDAMAVVVVPPTAGRTNSA